MGATTLSGSEIRETREGKGRKATGDGKNQIKEPAIQARSAADFHGCFGVLAEACELLHLRASPWEDEGRRHIFHLLSNTVRDSALRY